jgi:lipopolysaccharide export system protein LptA
MALMRWILVVICCSLLVAPALAKEKTVADAKPSMGDGPIEITADQSLEWYQDKHLYVARGNAKAVRGSMTIEADILTAHERETNQPKENEAAAAEDKAKKAGSMPGGGNLDRITAEGQVHIVDPRQEVFGDLAVYDLDAGMAKVTGQNLKYVTSHDIVTAQDSLEYYDKKSMAVARGKAVAIHDQRRVEADVLTARFASNAAGEMEMIDMTAEGNVTVLTGNDISRGDRAVYDIKRNVATMTGHVRVTRDDTQLSGDKAEVDFTKGESRLVNQGHGRVRALLVPKTVKEKSGISGVQPSDTGLVDNGGKIRQKTGSQALRP